MEYTISASPRHRRHNSGDVRYLLMTRMCNGRITSNDSYVSLPEAVHGYVSALRRWVLASAQNDEAPHVLEATLMTFSRTHHQHTIKTPDTLCVHLNIAKET